jgi:MFS family permease
MSVGAGSVSGFAPLRVRDFRLLFIGLVFAQALMPLQFVTSIFWVQDSVGTDNRIVLVGAIGTTRGVGALLFGLYGGALADRFDRRKLLVATQGTAFVLTLAVALVMLFGDGEPLRLVLFFSLTLIASAMWAVDVPTRQAMVPDLLGQRLTPAGISLNSAGMQVAMPVAIFASGFLVDSLGFAGAYALSAAGHVCAVAALLMMHYQPEMAARTRAGAYGFGQTIRDIGDGLRYTRREPTILGIVVLMVVMMGLGFPAVSNLGPTWVTTVVGVSVRNFGFVAIFWGLGAFLTSLALTRYSTFERKGRLLALATIGFGISFVVFSTGTLPGAVLGNLGLGSTMAMAQVCSTSLVQHIVPNEFRGRVMSILWLNMGLAQMVTLPVAAVAQASSLELMFPLMAFTLLGSVTLIVLGQRRIWRAAVTVDTRAAAVTTAGSPAGG